MNTLSNDCIDLILSNSLYNALNTYIVSQRFHCLTREYSNREYILFPSNKYNLLTKHFRCKNLRIKIYYRHYLNDLDLSNVHTLNLRKTDVEDVSMLGGVHTLYLSGTKVKDVSMLGGVGILDLTCTKVKDVSMLDGVHTLNLIGTKVHRCEYAR